MKLILSYVGIYAATILLCLVVHAALPGRLGAVIIGMLVGLVSAVPISLLLVALLRRKQTGAPTRRPTDE